MDAPALPGRYRDPHRVGHGGMADIYRATDMELGRPVAVKVLAEHSADDDDLRERFLREARAAARLSGDPNTVRIYDVGETEGRPYLVMEYLPGGSLAARVAAGRVEWGQAMEWLQQAARALDVAHEHGVVHRDVKPGNLLLDGDDNVYVADFGIAHAAGAGSNTQTGVILGTAGYLAPEQAAGRRATPASDEFALAVVAHELLTGSRPGPTPSSKLPPTAQGVFARALDEEPAYRYPTCLDFVAALGDALSPAPAPKTPPTAVTVRRRRRRTSLTLALVLAFGVMAFVLATALAGGNSANPPPTVVQTVTVRAPASARPASAPVQPQPVAAIAPGPHGKHHGKKKGHDEHGRG